MELFLDTANLEEISEGVGLGVITGVTTNPTLIAKERVNYKERILKICEIVSGPVSVEVLSQSAPGMVEEAEEYSSWAPNIVIKIPITREGLKALKPIHKAGIKTNVTLVFSLNQALLAAINGATYVSPFVGRLDDVGQEGMALVRDIVSLYNSYKFPIRVIAASIRHPLHVVEACRAGAHIATVPYTILEGMLKHPLTDIGVKRFFEDWQKAKEFLEKK